MGYPLDNLLSRGYPKGRTGNVSGTTYNIDVVSVQWHEAGKWFFRIFHYSFHFPITVSFTGKLISIEYLQRTVLWPKQWISHWKLSLQSETSDGSTNSVEMLKLCPTFPVSTHHITTSATQYIDASERRRLRACDAAGAIWAALIGFLTSCICAIFDAPELQSLNKQSGAVRNS